MKVFYLLVIAFVALQERKFTNAQGLQQLSYANADIGEKLIRPTSTTTTTTPAAITTTKSSGFFSGIRNIFAKKAPTATPSTPTTTTSPVVRAIPSTVSIPSATQTTTHSTPPPSTTTTTVAPSTTKTSHVPTPAAHRDEFPALLPPRNRPNSGATSNIPTVTSSHNAWTTTTTTHQPLGNNLATKKAEQLVTSTTTPRLSTDDPTDSDIETLTEALFNKESSNVFRQVTINYQGRTKSSAITDEAPEPLITVNDTLLDSVPSIAQMRLLYNNYELDASINEYVTPIEKKEENEFVDTILSSSLMRQAMLYLQEKGKVTADVKTHRDLIKTIWFRLYSRGNGKIGSSAFEHVFLSEIKNGEISGLHNWIYFHDEEKAGHVDYKGYIKKVQLGNKGAIVKYRLSVNDKMKPVNAMFIGTSPELEVALYTVCFQLRPDNLCPVSLGGTKFNIRTYTFRYRGKNLIGSAFPEI